jgi:glycosyltransferase involved in cell wall biosynthesis
MGLNGQARPAQIIGGGAQAASDASKDRTFLPKNARAEVNLDFAAAMRDSRHRVIATPRLREWFPLSSLSWLHVSLLLDIRDWLGHFRLIPFTLRQRGVDLILVKGFRTNLLAVVMLLGLWPFRQRLLFVVHHNLQYAHARPLGRTFKLLCRLGIQFALLEGDDGLVELGIEKDARQFPVLPLPVPESGWRPAAGARSYGKSIEIGVIGRDLPEKNADALMECLLRLQQAGDLPGPLLLASDNAEFLAAWAARGIATLNTRNYADYLAALARVDVLVMNYSRDLYFYRSSAVINDAASLGTAVVCPDYPVFRRQIMQPAQVGALFTRLERILPAIAEALEVLRNQPGNFELWAQARSAAEFSRRIDDFIDRRR